MIAQEFLSELSRDGIKIEAVGNELRIDAPKSVLTTELRQSLIEQKLAILTLLRSDTQTAASIQESNPNERKAQIDLDAPPLRLYIDAGREEIIDEILRLERIFIREGLHYDRVRYLGDNTLNRRKEFLLDYLYFLCDHLENYQSAKADLEERQAIQEYEREVEQKLKLQSKPKVVQLPKRAERKSFDFLPEQEAA